jgi:PAS domain S-box-containing protein
MSFEHDPEGAYDNRSREQLILELKELKSKRGNDSVYGNIKVKETRENALKWVEALFENSLPIPIQAFDLDGVVTHWNGASAQLYGFSAKEAIGRRLQDLILSGESARVFEECIKLVTSTGKPTPNRQWEINCRNGEKRWVYSTIFPIFENGRVTEIFCIDLDITERIKAEEELRKAQGELEVRVRERTKELNRINKSLWKEIKDRNEAELALSRSESFLKNTFDCIKDGITIMDADLNIIGVNNTMESWYPSKLPLVGKKCYFAYFGRSEPCEDCYGIRAIEKRSMQVSIRHSKSEDGSDRWREIYSYPFKDSHGKVAGAIAMVRNITDRKMMEDALLQAKSDAELYVDLMGHDINNMNQVGTGYLELVMDILTRSGKLDQNQHSLLSKSLESFMHSSMLIDNVRKIQRERRGDYEAIAIDVNDVLLEAIGQCSSATERNVSINYVPSPGCLVKANELIKDVFLNLIGNAIKHSDGPITIGIKVEKVYHNGMDYYKISVEDDGPGIPDDLKNTLFDRLNLASTHARGKGFGLCLIKMLVDDYSGMFWAEDRVPGDYRGGAKFVVVLPAIK